VGDPPLKPSCRDPKDDPILALAVSQRANYRFRGIKIFLIWENLTAFTA